MSRNDIPALYKLADVDVLETLLRKPYVDIYYNNSISGTTNENSVHTVTFFGLHQLDLQKELYESAFEYSKDKHKSEKFARKISRLLKTHELPEGFTDVLNSQIKDQQFLSSVVNRAFENIQEPQVEYYLEFLDKEHFKIHSNFDFSKTDQVTPETPILDIITATEDLNVMSSYSSEISTSQHNSEVIRLKLETLLDGRLNNQDAIQAFSQFIFNDSRKIREAINTKKIHVKALLPVLDKAEKFKDWLDTVADDENIIEEYIATVEEKTVLEFIPLGAIRHVAVNQKLELKQIDMEAKTTFDKKLLSNLQSDWKPNQFIERDIKPLFVGNL